MSHSASTSSTLFSATANAPFGLPLDPYEVKGKILSTPYNLVLSTSYLLSDKIFNYNLPAETENNLLQLWSKLNRKNFNNAVPQLYNLDTTTGAGNLLLGYLNEANPTESATVFTSSATLNYMTPVFLSQSEGYHNLPISLQLATVDYDFANGELTSNYSQALSAAKNLKLPVLTSSNALEAQYFSIVSSVLAKLNIANIHLFDGLNAVRTNQTVSGVLSSAEISSLYSKLHTALKGDIENVFSNNRISFALEKLNTLAKTSFGVFEYYGSKNASNVFVVYSLDDTVNHLFKQIEKFSSNSGVILVKSPLPFESAKFNSLISSNTKKLIVVSESLNENVSSLKLDVQAALFFEGNFLVDVLDASYDSIFGVTDFEKLIGEFVNAKVDLSSSSGSSFKFLLNDNSKFIDVPSKLAHSLSLVPDLNVKFRPTYDNSVNAGLFQVDIISGRDYSDKFDLIIIEDLKILNNVEIISNLKTSGSILIINDSETAFDSGKIIDKILSVQTKKLLASNQLNLKFIDLNAVGEDEATQGRTNSISIQVAFWTFAYPELDLGSIVTKILQAFGSEAELLAAVISNQIENTRNVGFKEIKFVDEWTELEEEEESTPLAAIKETAFKPNPREAFIDEVAVKVEDKFALAKKLIFKDVYGTTTSLRPDQPVKNFVVKVKENKRLTPSDYDRNIFHIEFDVSGTGLTYNIGEALGVHGRNDPELVDKFIEMYGLNGDDLVEVVSKENNTIFEVRTVRQSLIDNIDLLGKPPKRFYESLVEFTTEESEKKKLTELVSPAGAELFKKFQEEEFYSFADIFELFPSCRPSAEVLVQLIPALKRREYSIASSQKLHPNEVHLLIVVVDWVDNKGRKRFGQCSKFLSDLKVGEELVVSVKPSIMKLPPLTTQPIIMAGLGTGLAPFKAFIEERQYQLEQGHEIGEIFLYLGSRHKRQEYLYGEYWEAYMDADVLTYLGAAFSRDQKQKVYIQDKIRENLEELTDLMIEKNGHFYLCGPTWPVPDITACLQDILENDAKKKGIKVDTAKAVEDMKEEGRYVLEVY